MGNYVATYLGTAAVQGPTSKPDGTAQAATYNPDGSFAGWVTPITNLSPITLDSTTQPANPRVGINTESPAALLDVRAATNVPAVPRIAQFLGNWHGSTVRIGLRPESNNAPSPIFELAGSWNGFTHPFWCQFNVTGASATNSFGTLDWGIGPYRALSMWSSENRAPRVGFNNTTPFAQLTATPNWYGGIGLGVQLVAGQTADAMQVRGSDNAVITSIGPKGSFTPASLADDDAPNDSTYKSTDAGKLVYKDESGVVNALY